MPAGNRGTDRPRKRYKDNKEEKQKWSGLPPSYRQWRLTDPNGELPAQMHLNSWRREPGSRPLSVPTVPDSAGPDWACDVSWPPPAELAWSPSPLAPRLHPW